MRKSFFKNRFFVIPFSVILVSLLLLVAIRLINMNKFFLGGGSFEHTFGEVCSSVVGYANIISIIAVIVFKIKKKLSFSELFTCIPLHLVILFINMMFSLARVFGPHN